MAVTLRTTQPSSSPTFKTSAEEQDFSSTTTAKIFTTKRAESPPLPFNGVPEWVRKYEDATFLWNIYLVNKDHTIIPLVYDNYNAAIACAFKVNNTIAASLMLDLGILFEKTCPNELIPPHVVYSSALQLPDLNPEMGRQLAGALNRITMKMHQRRIVPILLFRV